MRSDSAFAESRTVSTSRVTDASHPVSTPYSFFRGLVRYCRTRTAGLGHVRADGRDTYHTYLKCIALTKTGLAIPVGDEFVTIPLDLWARKHTISVYIATKKPVLVPAGRFAPRAPRSLAFRSLARASDDPPRLLPHLRRLLDKSSNGRGCQLDLVDHPA